MMSKREQYGITFYQTITSDGNNGYLCRKDNINQHSHLTIICRLNISETESLINNINNAISGKYYEQFFSSDNIESETVELSYPNVIINGNLIIPMQDLKELLQEWLNFISD